LGKLCVILSRISKLPINIDRNSGIEPKCPPRCTYHETNISVGTIG